MTDAVLATRIGALALKNPLVAAAGEHLQTEGGIRAAIAAGAAVVISKSVNETAAARDQLERAEYRLLDEDFRAEPWRFSAPVPPFILSRSGLVGASVDEWVTRVAALDREAAAKGAYVAGSVVLADLDAALDIGRRFQAAGVRLIEFNVGAPYGDEAKAVTTERSADRIRTLVAAMRKVLDSSQMWIKLTGQSENVTALARAAREAGADAVVMIGRPLAMLPDLETGRPLLNTNLGYGGRWALPLACYWLAHSRRALGADVPLVGTNGARDGHDIARMLLAGAGAVEMCTAIMAGGFDVIRTSLEELTAYLRAKGTTASRLVGNAADHLQTFPEQPVNGSWRECVPPEARPRNVPI